MPAQDLTYGKDTAELIFTGGQIHTVNASNDLVEAVAVGGGRILAVRSTAEICALSDPGTREFELRGRSLLHGFIDAHGHLTGLGPARVRTFFTSVRTEDDRVVTAYMNPLR